MAEIDRRCRHNGLNRLEQEHADRMIRRAPVCRRIVCDGHRLFNPLRERWPHLEAIDDGESAHAAVAAASIVAKVQRDTLWHAICRRYQPEFGEVCGGGQTHRPGTDHRDRQGVQRVHRKFLHCVRAVYPGRCPGLATLTGSRRGLPVPGGP